jgi:hypothetical protein
MSTLKPDTAPDPFKPEVPVEPIRRQMHELESGLTLRIEELARENRRLRRLWMGTVVSGALLLGLATALVIVTAQHGLPGTIANVIEAKQFVLRDGQGNIRGSWSTSENGSMRLSLQAPKSKAGLSLAALADGASGITVRDSAGRSRAVVGLLPDQTVSLLFADENGTTRTVLSLVRGGSSTLVFADRSGDAKVGMGVDAKGQSTLTLPEPPESRMESSTPEEPSSSVPSPAEPKTQGNPTRR